MSITVGQTYKFAFKTDFAALDGIYTLTHAVSWETLLVDEIDLFVHLYNKVNKTEADLDIDTPTIKTDVFYRLQLVTDETVFIYIPSKYIVGLPNAAVEEYSKLMITVDLGTFANANVLATLQQTMRDVLEQNVGVTNEVEVVEYDTEWLTSSEYATVESDRLNSRTGSINNYLEVIKKDTQIADLQAQVNALTELCSQLNAQI